METSIRIVVLGRDDSDIGLTSSLMHFAKSLEHAEFTNFMESTPRLAFISLDLPKIASDNLATLFRVVESPVFLSWSGSPEAAEDRDPKTLRFQNTQRRRQQTKTTKLIPRQTNNYSRAKASPHGKKTKIYR